MRQYIVLIIIAFGIFSCNEEKVSLELNAKPSVLFYNQYALYVLPGEAWETKQPVVRGDGTFSFNIVSVSQDGVLLEDAEFQIADSGEIYLEQGHQQSIGEYVLAVEVSNEFGSLLNDEAVKLSVSESFNPEIVITTPSGDRNYTLYVDPTGKPVDETGNEIGTYLPGVSVSFIDMTIGEVLMTPSDLFLFDRESNHVEDGSDETGVIELLDSYEPGLVTLKFNGVLSHPEEDSLLVNIVRLNLPYDKDLFLFDLTGEDTGSRNDQTELFVGGMNIHLLYGALTAGKAFWNVQADTRHPVVEYAATPIFRWLPFNASTGYDSELANKSQSIAITDQSFDVSTAEQIRLSASYVSNKAADLTSELLRCDIRVATEQQYQNMLTATSQSEKRDAVNTWQLISSSVDVAVTAGAKDATDYGYYEVEAQFNKEDLPQLGTEPIRILFHMVADKDGPNPGYIALQKMYINGTFIDVE